MNTLINDIKYAIRQLKKNLSFTIVAVLTLALGIGANTAVFSVVDGVLLQPLPYKDPDHIVTLLHQGRYPIAPADFLDWRAQSQSFEEIAAAEMWDGTLTSGDRPENIRGIRMGDGLMDLLGVSPLLGRTFRSDDFGHSGQNVLVLSYSLWKRCFEGSSEVIGQSITLDNQTYTVIGVMPAQFKFPMFWATKSEMWTPLLLTDRASSRDGNSLRVFARLKPNVTRQRAQMEMDAICSRLEAAYPDTNTGRTVRVDVLMDKVVGDVRYALMVLLGAVGLVLAIACANVANLLLVRASSREKEMVIRTALGASRWRTMRQLLTESMIIASLGGLFGVAIGFASVTVLKRFLGGSVNNFAVLIPRIKDIVIDSPTLLFTLSIALLAGIVFGLAPALQAAKRDVRSMLKESGRGTSSERGGRRLRAILVVTEVALALVMLVGVGLLMRSFMRLVALDPGFRTRNVLSMTVSLAGQDDFVGPRRESFYQELFEKIGALPGVKSASAINHLPLAGDQWSFGIAIEGRPLPEPGEEIGATYRVCRPNYFSTMGILLLSGRDFSIRDRHGTPGVVIINETLAQQQFANENPIGKRLTLDDPLHAPTWLTIIGVVKDVRQRSWTGDVSAEVYLPWLQSKDYLEGTPNHFAYMTLVIRTTKNPHALVGAVQNAVWSLNKNAPASSVATLKELAANAIWQQRFNLILIGAFAGLALTLAGVGIYGVMAYSVAQRRKEIGIRIALGACTNRVLLLVISQGMKLFLAGVIIGVIVSVAVMRVLRSLLYRVTPTDPLTFVAVSLFFAAVALLACWLPARRATKIDPMEALRYE